MNDFELFKFVKEEEKMTEFGLVKIKNVILDSKEIEKILPQIVLDESNLKYMFQFEEFNDIDKKLVLNKFIPDEEFDDLENYISEQLKKNKTFYSFLAEGMMALVFRDIHKFKVTQAIIDLSETINDTHSGVDACMYDEENKVIVLGEAKFYSSFSEGVKAIINDLTNNSIKNKLLSLKKKAELNKHSREIILKNLKTDQYKTFTINEFLKQKIFFSGFVLHSYKANINNLLKDDVYDSFKLDTNLLKENIKKKIDVDLKVIKYEIILYHLPINDKKELIKKIINHSSDLLQMCSKTGG